jgi:hypothetical protein
LDFDLANVHKQVVAVAKGLIGSYKHQWSRLATWGLPDGIVHMKLMAELGGNLSEYI